MKKKLLFICLIPMMMWGQTTIYTNDMDYVIGDVKQVFINETITTPVEVFSLLKGFESLKVNGIRIPIFASGLEPDKELLDFFYRQAVAAGFDIFANPVHWNGGQRVANGVFEEWDDDLNYGGPVKDDPTKTQALIDRILEFDLEYPDTKWINPFNEDGSPGATWSASQMNTLYSTLKDKLVNAELIGACPWGVPAAIKVLKNTDVEDYITVSTAHNLGYNHTDLEEFINLSHAAGLPAWDSEVNHYKKYADKATRLEAAIAYGVDGLVLYSSSGLIDLVTGELTSSASEWMSLYLKPSSITDVTEDMSDLFDVHAAASGFTVFLLDPFDDYYMSVVDINGKVMHQQSLGGQQEYTVENLQPGMYIVSLKTDTEVQYEKLLVQ